MRERTQGGGGGYADDPNAGGAITGYEGAGSYDLADFTAAPGNADFGDFGGLDGGPGPMDDGGDGEPPTD